MVGEARATARVPFVGPSAEITSIPGAGGGHEGIWLDANGLMIDGPRLRPVEHFDTLPNSFERCRFVRGLDEPPDAYAVYSGWVPTFEIVAQGFIPASDYPYVLRVWTGG